MADGIDGSGRPSDRHSAFSNTPPSATANPAAAFFGSAAFPQASYALAYQQAAAAAAAAGGFGPYGLPANYPPSNTTPTNFQAAYGLQLEQYMAAAQAAQFGMTAAGGAAAADWWRLASEQARRMAESTLMGSSPQSNDIYNLAAAAAAATSFRVGPAAPPNTTNYLGCTTPTVMDVAKEPQESFSEVLARLGQGLHTNSGSNNNSSSRNAEFSSSNYRKSSSTLSRSSSYQGSSNNANVGGMDNATKLNKSSTSSSGRNNNCVASNRHLEEKSMLAVGKNHQHGSGIGAEEMEEMLSSSASVSTVGSVEDAALPLPPTLYGKAGVGRGRGRPPKLYIHNVQLEGLNENERRSAELKLQLEAEIKQQQAAYRVARRDGKVKSAASAAIATPHVIGGSDVKEALSNDATTPKTAAAEGNNSSCSGPLSKHQQQHQLQQSSKRDTLRNMLEDSGNLLPFMSLATSAKAFSVNEPAPPPPKSSKESHDNTGLARVLSNAASSASSNKLAAAVTSRDINKTAATTVPLSNSSNVAVNSSDSCNDAIVATTGTDNANKSKTLSTFEESLEDTIAEVLRNMREEDERLEKEKALAALASVTTDFDTNHVDCKNESQCIESTKSINGTFPTGAAIFHKPKASLDLSSRRRTASNDSNATFETSGINANKKPKTNVSLFHLPLQQGWYRETRVKGVGPGGILGEVVYRSPSNACLWNIEQVKEYLQRQADCKLAEDHFTFRSNVRVGDFYECQSDSDAAVSLCTTAAQDCGIASNSQRGFIRMSDTRLDELLASVKNLQHHHHHRRGFQQYQSNSTAAPVVSAMSYYQAPAPAHQQSAWSSTGSTCNHLSTSPNTTMPLTSSSGSSGLQNLLENGVNGTFYDLQSSKKAAATTAQPPTLLERELELRKEREVIRRSREEEKEQRREQSCLAKEQRLKDLMEEREVKRQQAILLKEQEKERKNQMAFMMNSERERQRQQLLFARALEQQKKMEERQNLVKQKNLEKEAHQQKKMEQRLLEARIAAELRRPVDDMQLLDAKPLPKMEGLTDCRLSCVALADCIMLLEFLHTFSDALSLVEESIPTLGLLQAALLDHYEPACRVVTSIVVELLRLALCDPGVPNSRLCSQMLGQRLADLEVNSENCSDVLRMFIVARKGHEDDMSEVLQEHNLHELSVERQASMLAFLVNELAGSRLIAGEVDRRIEQQGTLRRDRWIIEGKIRKLRSLQSRKFGFSSLSASSSSSSSNANVLLNRSLNENSNQSSVAVSASTPGAATAASNAAPATVIDKKLNGTDCVNIKEKCATKETSASGNAAPSASGGADPDSGNESDGATSETGNLSADDEDFATTEDVEKKVDRLNATLNHKRSCVLDTSLKLRGQHLGQDRFSRHYWSLAHTGGIFVEGLDSGEWDADQILYHLRHNDEDDDDDDSDCANVDDDDDEEEPPGSDVEGKKVDVKTSPLTIEKTCKKKDELHVINQEVKTESLETSFLSVCTEPCENSVEETADGTVKRLLNEMVQSVADTAADKDQDNEDKCKKRQQQQFLVVFKKEENSCSNVVHDHVVVADAEVKLEPPSLPRINGYLSSLAKSGASICSSQRSPPLLTNGCARISASRHNHQDMQENVDKTRMKEEWWKEDEPMDLSINSSRIKTSSASPSHPSSLPPHLTCAVAPASKMAAEHVDCYSFGPTASDLMAASSGASDTTTESILIQQAAMFYAAQTCSVFPQYSFQQLQDFYVEQLTKVVAQQDSNAGDMKAWMDFYQQMLGFSSEISSGDLWGAGVMPLIDSTSATSSSDLAITPTGSTVDRLASPSTSPCLTMDSEELERMAFDELITRKIQTCEPAPVPLELRNSWWRLHGVDNLRELNRALHQRGIRERELHRGLQRYSELIHHSFAVAGVSDVLDFTRPVGNVRLLKVRHRRGKRGFVKRDTRSYTSLAEEMAPGDEAFAAELRLLEAVELLEDKTLHLSLQCKGWQAPAKAAEDNTIRLVPRGRKRGGRGEIYPLDLARERLLQLEAHLERRYLLAPFSHAAQLVEADAGSTLTGNCGTDVVPSGLVAWRNALRSASLCDSVHICLKQLEGAVAWDKSIMRVLCQICRKDDNEAELLLCDGCDRGYHTYCFRPALESIPDGEWFCFACLSQRTGEPHCVVCGRGAVTVDTEEEKMMASCESCSRFYHLECTSPPLTRLPRKWLCVVCNEVMTAVASSSHHISPGSGLAASAANHNSSSSSSSASSTCSSNCPTAEKNLSTESSFKAFASKKRVRAARTASAAARCSRGDADTTSESCTSEQDTSFVEQAQVSLAAAPPFKKMKRSSSSTVTTDVTWHSDEECNSNMSYKSCSTPVLAAGACTADASGEFHPAAAKYCLEQLMAHEQAAPFCKPVNTKQVPFYKKIIKRPMDLANIKKRLDEGLLLCDEEFLTDVRLVFDNCETFNEDDSDVGRAGHKLRSHFENLWNLSLDLHHSNVTTCCLAKSSPQILFNVAAAAAAEDARMAIAGTVTSLSSSHISPLLSHIPTAPLDHVSHLSLLTMSPVISDAASTPSPSSALTLLPCVGNSEIAEDSSSLVNQSIML